VPQPIAVVVLVKSPVPSTESTAASSKGGNQKSYRNVRLMVFNLEQTLLQLICQ
jgi:hypothetical protein